MDESQADVVIKLMERIANALEATANSQYIIADRIARLVQIEEKRWGMTPAAAGFDRARWDMADPDNYGRKFE